MQYILTEEELYNLAPIERVNELEEALVLARKMITKLASVNCGKTYCDLCPISDITEHFTKEESRLVCNLPRRYSE